MVLTCTLFQEVRGSIPSPTIVVLKTIWLKLEHGELVSTPI